jgi:molecular chaperone HtpG
LEVLYLFDPVDEFVISAIRKYKDFDIKSVDSVDLKNLKDFKEIEDKNKKVDDLSKDDAKHFSSLLSRMKAILGERVEDVVESKRLVDSPACLISKDDSLSSTMQKIMRMANNDMAVQKKIFEVNPNHKLIRNLLKVFKAESNDEFISAVTEQLFETALLQEGNLTDPHLLVKHINQSLEQSSDWYLTVKKLE